MENNKAIPEEIYESLCNYLEAKLHDCNFKHRHIKKQEDQDFNFLEVSSRNSKSLKRELKKAILEFCLEEKLILPNQDITSGMTLVKRNGYTAWIDTCQIDKKGRKYILYIN